MIFFRIGAYLLLATGLLHLSGQSQGMAPQNDTEKQLIDTMTNYVMNIGSESVTMMGMFNGFSLFFTLLLLWTGTLSLVLSYKLKSQLAILKTISLINAVGLSAGVALSIVFFFSIPTVCLSLCFISFALAAWRLPALKFLGKSYQS